MPCGDAAAGHLPIYQSIRMNEFALVFLLFEHQDNILTESQSISSIVSSVQSQGLGVRG
jgi:hypothetical protein